MGIAVGRIEREFIVKTVMDQHMPVRVHGTRKSVEAFITDFNERKITLRKADDSMWVEFIADEQIRVFIAYYGHVMTFESKITAIEKTDLSIQYPTLLIKNLQRKYERVSPPEDVRAFFSMKGTKIELDYPKTEEYNPATRPEAADDFDSTKLNELVAEFKQKIGPVISVNKINMFRDKGPERFEERLISRFGKTFYLPSTIGPIPVEEPLSGNRIITRDMIEKILQEDGVQKANIDVRIRMIMEEKKDKGINSEVLIPILYHEYAVGYIYLANTGENDTPVGEDVLTYASQFAKVLTYSLKIHGYFKEEKPKIVTYDAKIIDISAAGMLFVHSSPELSEQLVLYTDFEMVLQIGPRKLKVPSRVMRKFKQDDLTYYGLLFLEIQPEDFRFLFDFVYGREYTEEDGELWEGGSQPPDIDIFKQEE